MWEKTGNTISNPSPFRYDLIHVSHGGIPASPVFTVTQSSLARVDVTVRATDSGQQATLELSPMASQSVPLNCGTTLGATPAKLVSYRTPGYRWQPIVDLTSPSGEIRMNDLNLPAYGRGHFRESYGDAVLAPGQYDVFADVEGRRLQIGQSQFPLQDPLHPTDEGTGLTQHRRLYSGSTLIGSSESGNINVNIPWAAHWYSYHADVTRKAGATLSTRISGIWRFSAHRVPVSSGGLTPPIWEVQLLPGQLDLRNQASAGTTTSVRLSIFGVSTATAVKLPVVRAYASANDGSTWSAVAVHSVGDHYVFAVHDPGQAGFVSLRVYVRAAGGSSEQLTVIHAYAVR